MYFPKHKSKKTAIVVLSVSTILRPWVQIPSTTSRLFSICIIEIVMSKGRK